MHLEATKAVLDRGGFRAGGNASIRPGGADALTEMSTTELRQLIADLEKQRADEAKVVRPEGLIKASADDGDDMYD